MTRPSPFRVVVVGCLLLASGLVAVAPAGNAGPTKKTFTASVSGIGAVNATTPSKVVVAITNTARGPQTFGSANITVPSAFMPCTSTSTTPCADPSTDYDDSGFHATLSGSIIEVRSASGGVSPGAAIHVSVWVTAESVNCETAWPVDVRQSNDFSGAGNDFVGAAAVPTGYLEFTTAPPAATLYNAVMSPSPVVTARDGCGHAVTSAIPVTLTDAYTPSRFSSSATTTATTSATNGQASFGNLKFGSFGFYDRLTATATGFTSTTSGLFIVAEELSQCDDSGNCSLDVGTKSSTLAQVAGTGSPGQYVSGSRLANTSGTNTFTQCTAQEGGNLQVSDTIVVDSPISKTVTMTIAKSLVNAVSNNGAPFMDICLSIPLEVQTADNAFVTKAEVAGGQPPDPPTAHEGLLPDCTDVSDVAPCVVSRKKNAANEIIVFTLPEGDPHAGAY